MYVQDPVSPGINITAEISEEEANNFKHMCKVFASIGSRDQTINKYLTKISEERSTYITITLDSNVNSTQKPVSKLVPKPKCSDVVTNLELPAMCSPNSNFTNASADLKPAAKKKLEDVIKVDTITKLIKIEMDDILTRSTSRIKNEQGIVKLLSAYVPTIKLTPFGSVTYGFGGASTDFNILINSGKFNLLSAFR